MDTCLTMEISPFWKMSVFQTKYGPWPPHWSHAWVSTIKLIAVSIIKFTHSSLTSILLIERRCLDPPPKPPLNYDFFWPNQINELGDNIIYRCPNGKHLDIPLPRLNFIEFTLILSLSETYWRPIRDLLEIKMSDWRPIGA